MKFISVFFLIGLVSAEHYNVVLKEASNGIVGDFSSRIRTAQSLGTTFGADYELFVKKFEVDIGQEIVQSFDEVLQSIVSRIEEEASRERALVESLITNVGMMMQILKDLRQTNNSKGRLENAKTAFRKVLHELQDQRNLTEIVLGELDEKRLIQKLEENLGKSILEAFSSNSVKDIRDLIGWILSNEVEDHQVKKRWLPITRAACLIDQFLANGWTKSRISSWINNNIEPIWRSRLNKALTIGSPALKIVLTRLCGQAASRLSPSLIKLWEKIKDFFNKLGLDVQEKYFRFAEWVRTTVKGGIEKVQDKVEKLKIIAREIITNSKSMTQEVAKEALEYFQPYKDDLGVLWDELKEATTTVIRGSAG